MRSSWERQRRDIMFWDRVAPAYDLFETVYNAKVYRNTGERVASEINENDMILEIP